MDIKPQLLAARRTKLFTVRATAPAYWRLTALDRFDGRRWSPSRPALHPRAGPAVAKNGLDPAAAGDRALHQDFHLTALDLPWLPAADKAIRIEAAGARLDPETDSLVTKKGSRSVRAYRWSPGSRSSCGAGPATAAPSARVDRRPGLARYLALPDRLPPRVRALAERFTSGATTPYACAAGASKEHLRDGFAYDESAPSGGSIDALDHFLFTTRRGTASSSPAPSRPWPGSSGSRPGWRWVHPRRSTRRPAASHVTTRRPTPGPRCSSTGSAGWRSSPRPAGPYRTPTPGCWPTPSCSGWRRRTFLGRGSPVDGGTVDPAAAPVTTPAPGTARAGSPGR